MKCAAAHFRCFTSAFKVTRSTLVVSVVSEKEAVEEPGEGEAVDEFDPLRRIGVPEKVASALKDAGY